MKQRSDFKYAVEVRRWEGAGQGDGGAAAHGFQLGVALPRAALWH